MANILEKFNEKGNLIKEYKYWKLLLKEQPNKLGRMVAILKREAFPLQKVTPDEMAEYAQLAKEVEQSLEKAFGTYLVQHLLLAYVDKQIHFHIIPRYKEVVQFEGLDWQDDLNPNPLIQSPLDVDRQGLDLIKDRIVAEIINFSNNTGLIKEPKSKNDVFDMWLSRLDRMDYLTRLEDVEFSFDIQYMIFPLLESVSLNLFGKSVRFYLQELGLSSKDADILVKMFRNGIVHNNHYYEMEYEDGKIKWAIMSSGGTSGILPYTTGEKVFEHENFENKSSIATLHLDKLVALVRQDLQERKRNYGSETIDFVTGQKYSEKRPSIE